MAAADLLSPVGRIIPEDEVTPLRVFSLAEIVAMSGLTLHKLEGKLLSASTGAIHKGKTPRPRMLSDPPSVKVSMYLDNDVITGEVFQQWRREADCLNRIDHPCIAKPFGYCWDEHRCRLIVVYYRITGTLKELLETRKLFLSWRQRIRVAQLVSSVICFFHTIPMEGYRVAFYPKFSAQNVYCKNQLAKVAKFCLIDNEGKPATYLAAGGRAGQPQRLIGYYAAASNHAEIRGFGGLLLELVTGASALGTIMFGLSGSLEQDIHEDMIKAFVDRHLQKKYPVDAARQIILLGIRCLWSNDEVVVTMEEVHEALKEIGKIEIEKESLMEKVLAWF